VSSRYLINASNLHTGGGVQVAVSFLFEVSLMPELAAKVGVVASTEVAGGLAEMACETKRFADFRVADVHGFVMRKTSADRLMDSCETVLTIFGPLYRWRKSFRSVVGFAQAWILYPDNECALQLPPAKRVALRFKYWVQAQFFRRADRLIVELEHVRQGVIGRLEVEPSRVTVVHNCLSSIYSMRPKWRPVSVPPASGEFKLGFVGRNHPHKNTAIFPEVAKILAEQFGIAVKFFVTFTPAEWAACSPEFQATSVNVGPISIAQCPAFYAAMDAVIFPSLLESFSATPLEALAMERPLIASDRAFVREVCGNHAIYFDPLSAQSAAERVAVLARNGGPTSEALRTAREHAFSFASARNRAHCYMDLLLESAS
jgi:glycosyltransferase involved in cell wall biosynthesis